MVVKDSFEQFVSICFVGWSLRFLLVLSLELLILASNDKIIRLLRKEILVLVIALHILVDVVGRKVVFEGHFWTSVLVSLVALGAFIHNDDWISELQKVGRGLLEHRLRS